jgi:Na+-driven multidrug efflux pump
MNASQRIVLNIAATYGRSVLALALAFFSSRWVLSSLGQTDYGLFSLVGSVIVFITFLNGVMACSVSRYLAYSIGQGDCEEVTCWFNTALSIHLCVAVILVLIGWPIGEYTISHVFSIPADRVPTPSVSECLRQYLAVN